MKKFIFLLALLLAAGTPAFAFHIGPATPAADHGEVNLGAGYFFYNATWHDRDDDLSDIDLEQNRAYLHIGYGLGMDDEPPWEVYFRGGASDLESDGESDDDFAAFAATGLKGVFHEGDVFGWGMVFQGAYFAGMNSNGVSLDDFWEIEFALPIQAKLGPVLLYAGPVFYGARGKGQNLDGPEIDLEEDQNFGGFGGAGLDIGPLRFEAEAQYKSEFSASGFVSMQF